MGRLIADRHLEVTRLSARRADDSADAGPQGQKQTLYKRCAVSGLRMGVTYVFLRVWCDMFILIKTRASEAILGPRNSSHNSGHSAY
jgi:hypothetical protein